jgi:NADPH-dependent curcumin reductase CurA
MIQKNHTLRLAARPSGMLKDSDFKYGDEAIPETLEPGTILVETKYLSVDPTQRIWMEHDSYLPAIEIGEVVRSLGAGRVIRSNAEGFSEGDHVQGMLGWQTHPVLSVKNGGANKLPPHLPLTSALSLFGLTGLTAYFGLFDVGRLKDGETVVVSGAAGATGNVVGQLAKIKGCRVIGIAGGPEKCAWIKNELGFDVAIDYKSERVAKRLHQECPKGIDVYFDNVGGPILDAALGNLAMRGRVVLCGQIGDYNNATSATGIHNSMNLVIKRGRMEGFIITDFMGRAAEAIAAIGGWAAEGKLKDRFEVVTGIDNAPTALRRLFDGSNVGKQLVKVSD